MPEHSPPPLPRLRTATAADADAVVDFRDGLARWLADSNVDQWREGELTTQMIAPQADAGEWHIGEVDGRLAVCVRLTWTDPDFWGADDEPAGYVHGLMVGRAHSGHGWGRALIEWAAHRTDEAGHRLLRLDTAAHNTPMVDYYRAQGFRPVRETPIPAYFGRAMSTMLLERSLIEHPPR